MTRRRAGIWGLGFVLLLLISAGMASVPGGDDPPGVVRAFYADHRGVIVVSQLISLLASAALLVFLLLLEKIVVGRRRQLRLAGIAVVAASVLAVVPPLWLCAVAGGASDRTLHALARGSDLTDVLVFLAIGTFSGVIASTTAGWLRALAAIVGVLAAARAILSIAGSRGLGLVAPLAFLVLVCALSAVALLGDRIPGTVLRDAG